MGSSDIFSSVQGFMQHVPPLTLDSPLLNTLYRFSTLKLQFTSFRTALVGALCEFRQKQWKGIK